MKSGTQLFGRGCLAVTFLVVSACVAGAEAQDDDEFREARRALVQTLTRQGIEEPRVLEAIGAVPRHEFVPEALRSRAYENRPLPIGLQQTISQPYIVALMTELLGCRPGDRVLEIGTGSGYQAAVLAELDCRVYSIEILPELGERAAATLESLGYDVETRIGDGYAGWPEHAPFDGVIVTAAPEEVPAALVEQLSTGGRMVVPVGPTGGVQELLLLIKQEDGTLEREAVVPVRFVPMIRQ